MISLIKIILIKVKIPMKNVLFIVNPVSGKLRGRTALFDVLNVFCKEGWSVRTALTQHRGHCRQLTEEAVKSGSYDLIVCCGGDGTLNEAISGLIQSSSDGKAQIPLGYIPTGSTNDFATTLGISSEPEEAAEAIVRGRLRSLDIGQFGDDKYFSYIASFGAFTAASYNANQDLKNIFGHFAYIIEGVRSVYDIEPERAVIYADGIRYKSSYIFCSVSNTTSAGGIVKLSEDEIDLNDGLFELMLIRYPESTGDMSEIIAGITTNDFSSGMFEFIKAKELQFVYEGSKAWTLDGEKAVANDGVYIKNLHSAIKMYI